MGAPKIKEELYQMIENGDAKLIKMLFAVAKEYSKDDFTLPGQPMSSNELKQRIRSAKTKISKGEFTSQEDLEKEMKEW